MKYRPHRYPTQYPVQLQTPAGAVTGIVIDVNETGARLECSAALRRGDKVTVMALTERVPGVVRWVGGRKIGVSFTPMIAKRVVDVLRRADKGSQARRIGSKTFGGGMGAGHY